MASIIVAVDENNGIGFNGELLEHIPEDMQRFRKLTTEGGYVMMGRKTYASLPNKPLPNRVNYIITSCPTLCIPPDHAEKVYTISMDYGKYIIEMTNGTPLENKLFVIGGGSIYKELLPYCNEIYMTKILKSHDNVDTYFPELNKANWSCVLEASGISNNIPYEFWHYFRKS